MVGNAGQAEFWDDRAPAWDELAERMETAIGEHSRAARVALDLQPGERVLDLGCGAGLTAVALGREVGDDGWVGAVDVSSVMAAATGRRMADAGISGVAVAADVQADDLIAVTGADTAYDAAHSPFGVMFFEDPLAAFANIAAALRPDGRFAASVWRDLSANPFMAVPTMVALDPLGVTDLPLPEPGAPGPFSMADPDATRSLLEDAGFVDVGVEAVDTPVAVVGEGEPWAVQAMRVGPLAAAYESADPDAQRATIAAVLTALDEFRTESGFEVGAASWTITARLP